MTSVKLSTLLLAIAASACHDAPPRIAISSRASIGIAVAVTSSAPSTAPLALRVASPAFNPPSSNHVALATWRKREPEHWTGFGKMVAHSPESGRRIGELALRTERVHVAILDGIARTEVEAEFENDRRNIVEGQWTFPLPPHATLSRLASEKGGEWIEGDVVDNDLRYHVPQGKLHSDDWLSEPKLLGSHGGEVFRAIVFPFAAKATRKLLLAYDQAPPKLAGRELYRFPMSMGPGIKSTIQDFVLEVTVLGRDAKRSKFTTPGYPTELRYEADRTVVTFRAQQFRPERDFLIEVEQPDARMLVVAADVPSWGKAPPQHAVLERHRQKFSAAQDPAKSLGYVAARIRLASPDDVAPAPQAMQDRFVIVDKSASQSATTFELEKRIAKEILKRAKPEEHVAVLACDSACERWSDKDDADVMTWLDRFVPSGASDLEGAIATAALSLSPTRASQIIWLVDGQATAGELEPKHLIERIARYIADKSVDLRLIGVGERLDDGFLTLLAQAVGATYDLVTTNRAFEEQAAAVANAILEPKLTELKVAFPTGIEDPQPVTWPGMRLGQTLTIAGRVTSPVRGVLHVTGRLGGRNHTQDVPINIEPASIEPNPLVAGLFLGRKIDKIESKLDHARLEFGVSEFARIARVASRHTGWIVLESAGNPSRNRPAGILPLRPSGIPSNSANPSTQQTLERSSARSTPGRFSISGKVQVGPSVTNAKQPQGRERLNVFETWFQACYTDALRESGHRTEGVQHWLLRIAPSGQLESVAVEGMRNALGAEFVECVRHAAVTMPLGPMEGRAFEVRVSVHSGIDWQRRSGILPIDTDVPKAEEGWGPSVGHAELPFDVTMVTGDDGWLSADATKRSAIGAVTRTEREVSLRSLLKAGQFARALAAAERVVAAEPDDQTALELMAMAAGAIQDQSRSTAALEALVELRPDDDNIRLTLAQAYLVLGDERRACAHLRGTRGKTDDLLANALRCRYRWFREGHTPMVEAERLDLESWRSPQPHFWQVANDITKGVDIGPPSLQVSECHNFGVFVHCDNSPSSCPEPVVVTPAGDVISMLVPMPGGGLASPLAFWMKTEGIYRVLLVGGEKHATGSLELRIGGTVKDFGFTHGAVVQTVATATVRSDERFLSNSGGHFCSGN